MTPKREAAPVATGAAIGASRSGTTATSNGNQNLRPSQDELQSLLSIDGFAKLVQTRAEAVGPRDWSASVPDLELQGVAGGLSEEAVQQIIAKHAPSTRRGRSDQRRSLVTTQCDVVCMADVTSERLRWLWPGRIPLGSLTMLEGDPKVGKSTLLLDIAARVTRGKTMPDGSGGGEPAGVVILTAEDGLSDTVKPRLEAAGADLSRVHVFRSVPDLGADGKEVGHRLPQLPKDLPHLEEIIARHEVILVIIDVLSSFLGGRDHNQDVEVRRALGPVAAMAGRKKAAIVAIRHLNKSQGTNPLYRGGGSIGIAAQSRSLLLAAVDPDDPSGKRRVLAVSASNLAKSAGSLGYGLVEDPEHSCARIEWLGPTDHRSAQLLAEPADEDERVERESIAEVITEALTSKAMTYPELTVVLRAAGLEPHKKKVQRILRHLGVIRRPRERGGAWWLYLPGGPFPQNRPAGPEGASAPSRTVQTRDEDPYPTEAVQTVHTAPELLGRGLHSASLDSVDTVADMAPVCHSGDAGSVPRVHQGEASAGAPVLNGDEHTAITNVEKIGYRSIAMARAQLEAQQ